MWEFNNITYLIQHDHKECPSCDGYIRHYLADLPESNDNPSLKAAIYARHHALRGSPQTASHDLQVSWDQSRERLIADIVVLGKFGLCLKLISEIEVLSDRFALKFWNHHP